MVRLSNKHRLPKKYVAFFAIVPLLLTTGLIQVECPVCEGSGYVSGARGMEDVVVIETESHKKLVNSDMNMCGMFVMYLYDVKLTVANEGAEDTYGYVKLTLIDLKEGKVVDNQYVILEIPAATSLELSFTVWFKSQEYFRLLLDEVRGEVVIDEVLDMTCNGNGRLPLNAWLVATGLKDTLFELGRESVQYEPPPEFDPISEQFIQ
jgi:hypothetical protein